jgi:hypothetical protein
MLGETTTTLMFTDFSEKWVISPLKQPKIEGNENGGNS